MDNLGSEKTPNTESEIQMLFLPQPLTEMKCITSKIRSVYVLSDPLNENEGKYKIGVHADTIENLVNRYITYLPELIIYFFIQTPSALKIENYFKEHFKSNRIINVHGNESEWYKMSLEDITKTINRVLNINISSNGKSIYSKKCLNNTNKIIHRNIINIDFNKLANQQTVTIDGITLRIHKKTS